MTRDSRPPQPPSDGVPQPVTDPKTVVVTRDGRLLVDPPRPRR